LLSFGVLFAVGFMDPDVKNIDEALRNIEPGWIAGAFLCILLYYFFDGLMMHFTIRIMGYPQSMFENMLTTMVGFFYSALTPFQSGGQPAQVIQMRGRGIPVGVSTSVMMVKFLAWQISVVILGILGLFWHGVAAFGSSIGSMTLLVVGYLLNCGVLLLSALAMFRFKWISSLGINTLKLGRRIRIIKSEEALNRHQKGWQNTVNDYREATRFTLANPKTMFLIWLISLFEAFFYMAVTYCVYRSFGLSSYSIVYVVLLQAMLFIAVSFIPLPGASIASEGGFYLVFSGLFSAGARFPAMLIWRVFTYYASLVLGLVAVVIDGFLAKRPKRTRQNIVAPALVKDFDQSQEEEN
ncbi:MAG: lysylphosphatidylglycerol synthase transmembrane domain-containing protein, partial [Synergistaceae bacterium]|nr:lysylphosphatidylglycerol synthase transmembrane domain-containing protein [Synergistaceae bacterium]